MLILALSMADAAGIGPSEAVLEKLRSNRFGTRRGLQVVQQSTPS